MSSRVYGAGLSVQWGEESQYGTPVAGDEILYIQSESLKTDVTMEEEGGIVANVGTSGLYPGKVVVGGGLSLVGKPENTKRLLKHLTGSNPLPVVVEADYVDSFTYKPAAPGSSLYSSTILVNRNRYVARYKGMKISKVDFAVSEGKALEMSVEYMGMSEDTGTMASGLTAPSKKAFRFAQSTLSLGGNVVADVYSVKATYDNGMNAGKNTLGSGLVSQEPDMGERKFTVDIEVALSTAAYAQKANILAGTTVAANLKFISPQNIHTTYYEQIEIVIPALLITKYEDNIGGKDEMVCKLSGEAVMSGDDFVSFVFQTAHV